MNVDQWLQLISTQGLALVLVLGFALWGARVLVPRYLDAIKAEVIKAAMEAKAGQERQTASIERQTASLGRRVDNNTDAIEVLSSLTVYNMEQQMTPEEYREKLSAVRALRRFGNGHVVKEESNDSSR